jgi:chloride channel protein, CIC family
VKEIEPLAARGRSHGRAKTDALSLLGDFTTRPRVLLISAIAFVVGTAGVIAGVALLDLIRLCTNLAYFGRFTLADLPLGHSPWGVAALLVPVAGALIVGLMARYGSEKIRGHGIPEAIEAILLGRSSLDVKVAILKPLSSAIAIGTGGPFGAEGPIIMTGGAIGSLIAQMLPVSDSERKTLLVAGAAAGMTTVFGTPIASIMLAVELLLFEWTPRSFVPVAVAAITAELERTWLHLPSPLFPFAGGMAVSTTALGFWVLIGVLAGLLSCVLTQLVYRCEDLFLKLPIHWMWWPMLGGLVVGIGGLIDPHALGVGYDNIGQMLRGGTLPLAALLLLVVKAIIWAVALGSGTSGGVLAPLLIMGGGMGAALAHFLPSASPGFWALLAMCATMGGTMRSPLTATFFAVELTGNTHVLLPLIASCVTAHLLTVLFMRRSILTEKVARRGHHLLREYRVDPFALTRVHEIMATEVETLPETMTLQQAAAFLTSPTTRHPSFPVTDAERRVLGIVDPPTVLAWRRARKPRHTDLRTLLAGAEIPSVYADEYLEGVIDRMMRSNVAHLAVISRADASLVGYLSWKDLLRVRTRLQQEEQDRVALFRELRRAGRERAPLGGNYSSGGGVRGRPGAARAASPLTSERKSSQPDE